MLSWSLLWPLCILNILLATRANSSNSQIRLLATRPTSIITGFYASVPRIEIRDPNDNTWEWNANTGVSHFSDQIKRCINASDSATEVKYCAKGQKVLAISGHSVVVIKHAPGDLLDKNVEFAVCLDQDPLLKNAHTAEMLPANLLAVATTGQDGNAGIRIYDMSSKTGSYRPKQNLTGIRAIHGMIWDEEKQTLWAAGNTRAANGKEGKSYGIVQGYQFNAANNMLAESKNYTMPFARQLSDEWGPPYDDWWNGPHDLVPIPSERILLIPMDRDIHALDLKTGVFNNSGQQLAAKYLPGFRPIGTRKGHHEELPRSDIKSISLNADGSAIYTQAQWKDAEAIPRQVNILSASGAHSSKYQGERMYRSRWFTDISGWPKA
ncbi:hypothetical protein HIM_09885 [Hirsutella minnesotensis 3608]|uniref:Uncharacterized protein n=1 Tax=Hirsutella minnesotensis 3608 TaxID=1043627 RepID=A0A0F7ZXH9_9HYPO|nr:hypothetical protein HIM_09885 [Hirsutella minnesotensis 3608]